MIAPQGYGRAKGVGGSPVDRRLWYLIAGTRGGINRARILSSLREQPHNANDLAGFLDLDYKTVRHHLGVLRENGCIMALGAEGYGMLYSLSPHLQTHFEEFLVIWRRLESRFELGKAGNTPRGMDTVQG